jgi:hypothetical protein
MIAVGGYTNSMDYYFLNLQMVPLFHQLIIDFNIMSQVDPSLV